MQALTDVSESDRMFRMERWGVEGAEENVGEGDERCGMPGYATDLHEEQVAEDVDTLYILWRDNFAGTMISQIDLHVYMHVQLYL